MRPDLWGPLLKYVGIAFAGGLGVAGTIWETRGEHLAADGSKHERVTVPGKLIVVAIIVSSLLGAVGVAIEEEQRRRDAREATEARARIDAQMADAHRASAVQIASLVALNEDAKRQRYPFQNHASISAHFLLPANQPRLMSFVEAHAELVSQLSSLDAATRDARAQRAALALLKPVFRELNVNVVFYDQHGLDVLTARSADTDVPSPDRHVSVGYIHSRPAFDVRIVDHLVVDANRGIGSLLDFRSKRVEVSVAPLRGRPRLRIEPKEFAVTDDDSHMSLLLVDWNSENNDVNRWSAFHTNTDQNVAPGTLRGWR